MINEDNVDEFLAWVFDEAWDEEDEPPHRYDCVCEDCVQNHPERWVLYGPDDDLGDD